MATKDGIPDSIGYLANAVEDVALQLKWLGAGDNSDPRGAVEFLGCQVETAGDRIAGGLGGAGESVGNALLSVSVSLDEIASAINALAGAIRGREAGS